MNILRRSFSHIAKSWKHHTGLQFSTALILTVSFAVIMGVLTVTKNLQNILTLWGDSLQMSVFINEDAAPEKIANLQMYLKNHKKIENVKFISSEEALHDFKDQMASYAPGLLNDSDLLKYIPTSFQLAFKSSPGNENQLEDMKTIAGEIKAIDGVDEVSFGQDWVKNYSMITKLIQIVGLIIILVTGVASVFVISNSIRASISQRRKEIEVLELIGATQSHIQIPFILEGAIQGFCASFIAVAASAIFFYLIKSEIQQQLLFLQLSHHIQFLSFDSCLIMVCVGTAIGALSSWLCVRKINSGWAAASRLAAGE